MQVFILCTGRSGSVSFIKACQHIKNFTSAHESRSRSLGAERLNYPENHIEADNRLSWFLGPMDEKIGNRAIYVHLIREREATINSWISRWGIPGSMIDAFEKGILMLKPGKRTEEEKYQISADYYDTVNSNIRHFLKDKSNTLCIELENIETGFIKFWNLIGAEGDQEKAIESFRKAANTSASRRTLSYKFSNLIYRAKNLFK